MWHAAMKKHMKEPQQNVTLAPVSEEQPPTKATLGSTEITPTHIKTSTKELLPSKMTNPLMFSSSEFSQQLWPRKRFRRLRHGYEPSSSQLLIIPSPLPCPPAGPSGLLVSIALANPLAPSTPQESSLAPTRHFLFLKS